METELAAAGNEENVKSNLARCCKRLRMAGKGSTVELALVLITFHLREVGMGKYGPLRGNESCFI